MAEDIAKACSRCDLVQPQGDFPMTTARGKLLVRSWCRGCLLEYYRQRTARTAKVAKMRIMPVKTQRRPYLTLPVWCEWVALWRLKLGPDGDGTAKPELVGVYPSSQEAEAAMDEDRLTEERNGSSRGSARQYVSAGPADAGNLGSSRRSKSPGTSRR